MTSGSSLFPTRLTKIDELSRGDHSYLDAEDECYFFGDYTARRGFKYSATNQLIFNYKKSVKRRDFGDWQYKVQAIQQVAEALASSLSSVFNRLTLVPIPTSKVTTDPAYDSRIVDTLRLVRTLSDGRADCRELVRQSHSMQAAHDGGTRSIDTLIQDYSINRELLKPTPKWIGVFDDVLTTGCHFKAMSRILRAEFPDARISGIFIARRVPEAADFEDLPDNE